MTLFPPSEQEQWRIEGYKAGQADRRINHRSDYAFFGIACEPVNTYTYHYSIGYRQGIFGLSI